MTVEEIYFDPPTFGDTPLADFIDQLRGIQAECPPKVIPMVTFRVVHRFEDTDIEGTVSYPRLETGLEMAYRMKREAFDLKERRKLYEKLKQEFGNETQTGLLGSSGESAEARVHTSPLHLVHSVSA
jgi:hypothetical protein